MEIDYSAAASPWLSLVVSNDLNRASVAIR